MKQYDSLKMYQASYSSSMQQPIQPVDISLPLHAYNAEVKRYPTEGSAFEDISSADEADHYSGYEVNVSTSESFSPTLKLRHIVKAKVDYGRDRDVDVEGVNDYLLWYENFQNNMPRLPTLPRQQKCTKPIRNVAFIKTHHTGSDVVTNILNRYADLNYLNVALPSDGLPTFFWPMRFQWKHIDITMLNGSLPNIISNHARYNNDVMDNILNPGSVYVTILRDPVTQLETTFNNMGFGALLQVTNTTDQLLTFLKNPKHYIQGVIRRKRFKDTLNLIKNAQFFDLGLSTTEYHRKNVIKMTIQELYEKFSLVLIYEFLDESLLLMKRRLCWQLDDILYLKFHYTNHDQWNRKEVPDELRERIQKWNQADVYLYEFFNKTLWKEIEYEGEHFWKELDEFKRSQRAMETNCMRDDSFIPKDEKFALSDVPTTARVMTTTTNMMTSHVEPLTTPTPTVGDPVETSGDVMYVHKDYRKPANRTLRDVLVRSRVIPRQKETFEVQTANVTIDTDANNNNNNINNNNNNNDDNNNNSNDKNNNNLTFTFGRRKEKSVDDQSTDPHAGNLYTDTTDQGEGSGTGKSFTTVLSSVQRLLSKTVTPWDTYLCKKLLMTEVEYLDYFRKKHVYGKTAQRK